MKFFVLVAVLSSWQNTGTCQQVKKVENIPNEVIDEVIKNRNRLDYMEKNMTAIVSTVHNLSDTVEKVEHNVQQNKLVLAENSKIIKEIHSDIKDIHSDIKEISKRSSDDEKKISDNMNLIIRLVLHNQELDKKITENTNMMNQLGVKMDRVVEQNKNEEKKIIDLTGKLNEVVEQNKNLTGKLNKVVEHNRVNDNKITANTKVINRLSKMLNESLKNIGQDVNEVKGVLTNVRPGKTNRTGAKSCEWLNEHNYNLKSGKYWLSFGGRTSFRYCKMDEGGIPPPTPATTTVVPTTVQSTERPTTVQPTTHPATTTVVPTTVQSTKRPTTVHPTTHPVSPGSCKDLKRRYPELKSGMYDVTVGGSTFAVFCDMETDEGGWTMVGKAVVNKESEAKEVEYTKIQWDDFHQLHKVTTGRFLLSTYGLNSLYNIHKFTELRLQCFKPYHGRHLDVKTKGSFVLEWLLERRSQNPEPPSCGTFTPLHNDRSFFGHHCEKWWGGKWNDRPIYDSPMFASDGRRGYWVSLDYNFYTALYCDDWSDHPNFNNKGSWSFYIR